MTITLRRLLPDRLRHHTRVIAIQCHLCGQWRKPRHIRIPAMVCRDCETTPAFQTWQPATSTTTAAPAVTAYCSGCGEPAVNRPPQPSGWLTTWTATGHRVPAWSHRDGEPLCPVIGPHGYQPAQPTTAPAAAHLVEVTP
ncbi:MAG TPA: hypothetical protein VFM55_26875 [Micromonosporaceae bacterium]|nr:hypothetical protein [Micromonosporaceae bacterium]